MKAFDQLISVIKKLRSPRGCPWDRVQTHRSLKPYLIEETYEVLDAIDSGRPEVLQDELGDLLLQIVLHAQIADEQKKFDIEAVVNNISAKMIRRHPHVFAKTKVKDVKDVWRNWEKIKKTEKIQKSILDSIPAALPALYRATKVQKKAARVGFDWPDSQGVLQKIKEEIHEFEELKTKKHSKKAHDEFGDILFSLVNLARKLDLDAEDALRLATKKFEKRFKYVEQKVTDSGKDFKDYTLSELDKFWEAAKKVK
jgi:tetrapyrrole methylase family protein/MazG family protein